jgi:hypothetical protein
MPKKASIYLYDVEAYVKKALGNTESTNDILEEYNRILDPEVFTAKLSSDPDYADYAMVTTFPESFKRADSLLRITTDPYEADLFWLPIYSFGFCLAAEPDFIRSWQMDKGGSLPVICDSYRRVLREVFETSFYKRSLGMDHMFYVRDTDRWTCLYEKNAGAERGKCNIDFAMRDNLMASIIVTEEDRRGNIPHKVLIPYYADVSKWAVSEKVAKVHKIAFAGSTSVRNRYCPACSKDISPKLLRHKILVQVSEEQGDSLGGNLVDFGNATSRMDQSKNVGNDAVKAIQEGIFCPIPRGDTSATKRLFCAIVALCIPVIVSDALLLPFENIGVPWRDFMVRIPEHKIVEGNVLLETINAILEEEATENKMGIIPSLSSMQKSLLENRERFSWGSYKEYNNVTGDAFYHVAKELQARALDLRSVEKTGAVEEHNFMPQSTVRTSIFKN